MITIRNLNINFDKPLFINQNLQIKDNCVTLVVGESGCGKTTLLYKIGLIDFQNEDGSYFLDDININNLSKREKNGMRRYDIAFVFQEYMLYDHLNVFENLQYYATIVGKNLSSNDAKKILQKVHLEVELDRCLCTLSGGQKQRLAIACALTKESKILILDEPTSALDEENALGIFQILQELKKDKTIIITSHNQLSYNYCDEIIKIENGSILKIKETDDKSDHLKKYIKIKAFNMHLSFQSTVNYIKKQFYFTRNTKFLIFISNILILFFCVGIIALINHNITNSKEIISQQHQGWIYVPTLQESDLKEINMEKAYPFYEISVGLANQTCPVIPYYDEIDIVDKIWTDFDISKEKGIYISQNLNYLIKSYIAPSQSIELYDFNVSKNISFVYKGILLKGISSEYIPNNLNFIYMPHSLIEEKFKNKKQVGYTLFFDNYKDLINTRNSLNEASHKVVAYDELDDIEKYIAQLDIVQTYIIYGVILIGVIVLYYIYRSYIHSREKEIALLKSMGLTNLNITKLFFWESIIMCIMGFCFVIVCMRLFVEFSILKLCWYELILILSIFIIVLLKIIRINPIKVLRNS